MTGQHIRVVLAIVGLDQHEVGSLIVARILSAAGMEVIYLGRFNTPESVLQAAVAEDADVVGVSCHSWEFLEFGPALAATLAEHSIPLVLGGSLITSRDSDDLTAAGVFALLGAGTSSERVVEVITEAAERRRLSRT